MNPTLFMWKMRVNNVLLLTFFVINFFSCLLLGGWWLLAAAIHALAAYYTAKDVGMIHRLYKRMKEEDECSAAQNAHTDNQ